MCSINKEQATEKREAAHSGTGCKKIRTLKTAARNDVKRKLAENNN